MKGKRQAEIGTTEKIGISDTKTEDKESKAKGQTERKNKMGILAQAVRGRHRRIVNAHYPPGDAQDVSDNM